MIRLFPLAAVLSCLALQTDAACWSANVTQWTWCWGYEKVGYTCAGDMCSSSVCDGECTACAASYPSATLVGALCCGKVSPNGENCEGPAEPGTAPFNPEYGFPIVDSGALIVEGPVAYPRGPAVWSSGSKRSESGAYGWWFTAPPGASDAKCPPPPAAGSQWAPGPGVRAISLKQHGAVESACALLCNTTAIAAGGVDPCNAGTISNPSWARGVYANYSCYYGGEGYIRDPGMGICGFNCSARASDGSVCSAADIGAGKCDIYCDSRLLPNKTATAADRTSTSAATDHSANY